MTAKADDWPPGAGRDSVVSGRDREFSIGLARAVAGALIFALPMLMTMGLWWIGFYIDPGRLILLLVLEIPLLAGLSRFSGSKPTAGLWDDIIDAFVTFAVALATPILALQAIAVSMPERGYMGGEKGGHLGFHRSSQQTPGAIAQHRRKRVS